MSQIKFNFKFHYYDAIIILKEFYYKKYYLS